MECTYLARSVPRDKGYPARFFIRIDDWRRKVVRYFNQQMTFVEKITIVKAELDNEQYKQQGTKENTTKKTTHYPTTAPTPPLPCSDPLSHQSDS